MTVMTHLDALVATVRRVLEGPDGTLALALVLTLAGLAEAALTGRDDVAAWPTLLTTLPLALARWSLPLAAALVVFGAIVALATPDGFTVAAATAVLATCFLFASRYRRRWLPLLALPFVGNAVTPFSSEAAPLTGVLLLALVVAALALGDARRQRGQALAERDFARRDHAVLAERARIARELHDIVAHHVSAIAVQAETARLTTPGLPPEGAERLEAIGAAAREALGDLRRLLGVLRAEDGTAERGPQPGLAQLDELIETARAAGTPVSFKLGGDVVPLAPSVDLSAYRIVQEALTNARRHAPGARVEIVLAYGADTLRLRVGDEGPGAAAGAADGHGLAGMRERAALVGGTLRAGPANGRGFAVEAVLPLAEPAA